MNVKFLKLGVPAILMAALAAGCSTQATNEPAAAASAPPASGAASARPGGQAASSSTTVSSTPANGAAQRAPSARSVYYEFDSSALNSDDRKVIEDNVQYLRGHPDAKVRIEGNADERGSAEYNLALGQRRADGVMQAIRLSGVSAERMEAVSYGKEKPRASGHDETSWSQNRRSDIVYR